MKNSDPKHWGVRGSGSAPRTEVSWAQGSLAGSDSASSGDLERGSARESPRRAAEEAVGSVSAAQE